MIRSGSAMRRLYPALEHVDPFSQAYGAVFSPPIIPRSSSPPKLFFRILLSGQKRFVQADNLSKGTPVAEARLMRRVLEASRAYRRLDQIREAVAAHQRLCETAVKADGGSESWVRSHAGKSAWKVGHRRDRQLQGDHAHMHQVCNSI